MPRRQTNIRLEERILDELREKASSDGRTVSDIIREYLARGLRRDRAEETPQRAAG